MQEKLNKLTLVSVYIFSKVILYSMHNFLIQEMENLSVWYLDLGFLNE